MVKRGGDFNSDNNHWEWFMLDPVSLDIMVDGAGVTARGANLMDGMCNNCHATANSADFGIDYVFKHENDPFNSPNP
jgi:hypothetical protein